MTKKQKKKFEGWTYEPHSTLHSFQIILQILKNPILTAECQC